MIKYLICDENIGYVISTEKEYKNHSNLAIQYLNEDNKLHKLDGPALQFSDKSERWYKNGVYHREDGPAVEYSNRDKFWFKNGLRHREDGPAVEYSNGDKFWFKNGLRHREDGPALEYSNGKKKYYYNDQFINVSSDKEFKYYLKFKVFI